MSIDEDMVKLMRKESSKWHPDVNCLKGPQVSDVDRMTIREICHVVTELLNKSAGKSSDFWVEFCGTRISIDTWM